MHTHIQSGRESRGEDATPGKFYLFSIYIITKLLPRTSSLFPQTSIFFDIGPPPLRKNVLDPRMQRFYKNGMKFLDTCFNCFIQSVAWKKRFTSHSVNLYLSETALWKIDNRMKNNAKTLNNNNFNASKKIVNISCFLL